MMFSVLKDFKKLSQLDSDILEEMKEGGSFVSIDEWNREKRELLLKERDQLKEKINLYIQIMAIVIAFMNGVLALIISFLPYLKN